MKVSDEEHAAHVKWAMSSGQLSLIDLCNGFRERLEAAKAVGEARSDLIMWYEEEAERSCREDSTMPPEVLELEKAIDDATQSGP